MHTLLEGRRSVGLARGRVDTPRAAQPGPVSATAVAVTAAATAVATPVACPTVAGSHTPHAGNEVRGARGVGGSVRRVAARREGDVAHTLREVACEVRVAGDGLRVPARREVDVADAVFEVGVPGGGVRGRVGTSPAVLGPGSGR